MTTITKETETINEKKLDFKKPIAQVEFFKDQIRETMEITGKRYFAGQDRQSVIIGLDLALNVLRGDI